MELSDYWVISLRPVRQCVRGGGSKQPRKELGGTVQLSLPVSTNSAATCATATYVPLDLPSSVLCLSQGAEDIAETHQNSPNTTRNNLGRQKT